MQFPAPLVRGTLVQRYKRFLADVTLDSGETVTAHLSPKYLEGTGGKMLQLGEYNLKPQ